MRPHAHLAATCLAVVMLIATAGCARAQLCPQLSEIARELDELDAEIALIQDMNTLQLEEQQLRDLLPAVEDLRSAAISQEQRRAELLHQLKPLLEQRRDLALQDRQPSEELADQVAEINNQLVGLDEEFDEAILAHAQSFRDILTEPQIAIVTGEEEARRQVLTLIEWVRELDDAAFEQEVPPLADELADPDVGLGAEEIVDLLGLARAMTAEQYQRAGEEIRGRLIELYRPDAEDADRIIVNVFLNEAMPAVLEDMLEVAEG